MVPSTSRSTSVCIRCVICETIHLPSLIVMRISQRNKKTFTLHVAVHLYMFCQATTFFHQRLLLIFVILFIPARFWLLSLYPSINKKLAKNPRE